MAKNKLNSYDYELKRGNGSPFTDTQWMKTYRLKTEARPYYDDYYGDLVADLEWWECANISINALEEDQILYM